MAAFVSRLGGSMEHPVRDCHDELTSRNAKARPPRGDRAWPARLGPVQPRVRERIMKLSKVYSATCHHRYWSERYACIASIDFLKSAFFAEISPPTSWVAFRQASRTSLVKGRSCVPPETSRFNAVGFCMS